MNPNQEARYADSLRRIGELTQDYLRAFDGDAPHEEPDIHDFVSRARIALGRLDRELFSLYGLLDTFRREDHYTFNPDRPARATPTPAFTLDDL